MPACYFCWPSHHSVQTKISSSVCTVPLQRLTTNSRASIATVAVIAHSNATISTEVTAVTASSIGNIAIVVTTIASSTPKDSIVTGRSGRSGSSRSATLGVVTCDATSIRSMSRLVQSSKRCFAKGRLGWTQAWIVANCMTFRSRHSNSGSG